MPPEQVSKRELAAPGFAVVVGFGSAVAGLWLALPDRMSVGLVLAAFAAYLWFGWALHRHRKRSLEAYDGAKRSTGTAGLRRAGMPELAGYIESNLERNPKAGRPQRRRVSAAAALRDGSPLVPSSIRPGPWLSAGQPFLVSLGLFGTFVGLSYGLQQSIPYIDRGAPDHAALLEKVDASNPDGDGEAVAMQTGMSELLGGARTAFSKSVAGIGLGLSYMLLWRLALAAHRQRLEEVGLHVDGFYDYISSEDLLLEQLADVSAEVRLLRESQPDVDSLRSAGAQLSVGAEALVSVASQLGGVTNALQEFRAAAIAREVRGGVQAAVEECLTPTMERIADELVVLRELKSEQDDIITGRLDLLVQSLTSQVLLPMTDAVAATNEQTRHVAAVVRELSGTVTESSQAVRSASEQMSELTNHLSVFQQETLVHLNIFADRLGEAMARQRDAFEASAASATRSFAAQTTALTSAGEVASDAIRRAGSEASDALLIVSTTFAEALAGQQDSLKAVLGELESSFNRDLIARKDFERLTTEAITKVQKLVLVMGVGDAEFRQATIEASASLGQSLGVAARQAAANREALDQLQDALAENLRLARDAYGEFLQKEDAHLTNVLNALFGLVNEIERATRAIQDRTNGGAIDARA